MLRTPFVSAIVLGLVSLVLTKPATAEATRPLVRPPSSIHLTRLHIAMPLADALSKKTVGLDLEDQKTRALAMKQAREYADMRNGGWPNARIRSWLETCEKQIGSKDVSPFCRTELERFGPVERGTRFRSEIRLERREISELLKDGQFAKVAGKSYQDVMLGLAMLGDAQTIEPLANKALKQKECAPSSVTTALGYKTEELFPQSASVELTKNLYKKSVSCGDDYASAQAAFRLGLILVWQNQCGEIDGLMKKVESVPEASQFHARAKFWRYHCAGVAKNEKGRTDARESLVVAHPMSFQNLAVNGDNSTMMARVLRPETPTVMMRSVVRPDMNGVIRGVEALERLGERHLAADLVDRNTAQIGEIEPEVRLYTAALLDRMGQTLVKFKVLSSLFQEAPRLVSKTTMEMMFPLIYADLVKVTAKKIDPLLILSLMRQESAFNPSARSVVGARGLMQVMPATARSVASVRANLLFDPATNVGVGTKYFMKRLMQYGGDVELTLAAYNAGFARVDQWLKRYPTQNKLLFLDFIPFKETREYVSSILRNYYWYVRLYSPETSSSTLEAKKMPESDMKVQAIMSANAGLVASQAP